MRRRWKAAVTAAVCTTLVAVPAAADVTKAQCVDADTNAQSLRRDGKLAEARAALAVCGDPACPSLVRDDCTRQLDELNSVQPTVIFDVKNGSGADVVAAKVGVDGHALEVRLDGTPLAMDPGTHTFSFEVDGLPPVTLTVVLKESEKARLVRVTVGPPPRPPLEEKPPPPPPPPPPAPRAASSQRTLGIVGMAAGGGVVALGGVFGLMAASAWSTTKAECTPQACPNHDQAVNDRARTITDGTVATVGLVAGTALLGGGALLFFTAGSGSAVSPEIGQHTASLTWRGRF
ncbi:MAG TPA: hypothetical protein VGG39_24475 [Polyangiaceae bacterium]|jgi:hypothetical protein